MKTKKNTLVVLALLAAAVPALAGSYVELVPFSTLSSGSVGTSQQASVVDGQTAYFQLSASPSITAVTPLNGVMTTTQLMDNAAWFDASGKTAMTTWYGFGVAGNYLQFTETSSDQVWRVDKTSGAITAYATQGDILAVTGLTSVSLLSPSDVSSAGETAFYEGNSDSILVTNGPNNVQVLLSAADLLAATGNSVVSGGMSFDAAGDLYWGTNTSDDLWRRNGDASIDQVLTAAEIMAVSGGASVSWKDVFAAPDGWVYFGENTSDHIMRFDPADAVNTLEIYLSATDLAAGPMGSNNMISLSWYDPLGDGGDLTFHTFSGSGLYWVPEPASLAALALGLLLLRRR